MNWYSFLTVFFTASTKFLVSPFVGVNGFGLTMYQTLATTIAGGVFGTIFFFVLGRKFADLSRKKRQKKIKELISLNQPLPRVMTRTNKIIIKTKQTFGIWGLAFLTASILSIPIGSVICAKFYRHKRSAIFIIFLFIVTNSLIISSIANLFPAIGT